MPWPRGLWVRLEGAVLSPPVQSGGPLAPAAPAVRRGSQVVRQLSLGLPTAISVVGPRSPPFGFCRGLSSPPQLRLASQLLLCPASLRSAGTTAAKSLPAAGAACGLRGHGVASGRTAWGSVRSCVSPVPARAMVPGSAHTEGQWCGGPSPGVGVGEQSTCPQGLNPGVGVGEQSACPQGAAS